MRIVGPFVALVLAGGLWVATASATTNDAEHLAPAATSTDHAPFCDVPDAPAVAATAGGTAVSFRLLPDGC